MNRLNSTMNSRYDENRTRSANEPVIKAGVMIANLSWNIAKITSGTVAHNALFVASPTPSNIRNVIGLPITPPRLSPKARLKPTATQIRLMTPSATTLWSIVETTFFRLTIPP